MENTVQSERKPQIAFAANQELVDDLREVSEKIQIPVSQIAREALWEKLREIKTTHPAYTLAETAATA